MRRILALLLTLFLVLPMSSLACICEEAPITSVEFLKWVPRADAVFLGRVFEVEHRIWDTGTAQKSESNAKLTVVEAFKGVEADAEIVIGTYHQTSCEANLSVRATYLIFANHVQPNDGNLHVSRCGAFFYEADEGVAPGHNERLKMRFAPILESLRQGYR